MNCKNIITLVFAFLVQVSLCFAWESKISFESNGSYYTGSQRFSGGVTCINCHTGTLSTSVFNVSLYDAGMTYSTAQSAYLYIPAESYNITITIASPSDYSKQNGFVLEVLDSNNQPGGNLVTSSTTQLSTSPEGVLLDVDNLNQTSTPWSFTWTAPASASGPLKLYFAGVSGDGNGDDNPADITDAGSISLVEQPSTSAPGGAGCGIIIDPSVSLEESACSIGCQRGLLYQLTTSWMSVAVAIAVALFGIGFVFAGRKEKS